jgi:signal transduction histidine kinase
MRRRAAALGGNYEIESKLGSGTISILRVPVKSNFKFAHFFTK